MSALGVDVPSFVESAAAKAEAARMALEDEKTAATAPVSAASANNADVDSITGGVDALLAPPPTSLNSVNTDDDDTWVDNGGYVNPRNDCPHVADHMSSTAMTLGVAQVSCSHPRVQCFVLSVPCSGAGSGQVRYV